MNVADDIIAKLGMRPHPEGGWYVETWRADAPEGERAVGTAIYFLLKADERSHWHRVDAHEVWLWHSGAPLTLSTAEHDAGPVTSKILGPNLSNEERPQLIVPAHHWQAAKTSGDYTLVSCIVTPGFTFDGFELAPDSFHPGAGKLPNNPG